MSVAIFGGNGFLGKRIAQQALDAGFKVVAFSRSGQPPAIKSHHDAYWINHVSWKKADIFKPETYKKELKDVSAVVHSIGILFEDQTYKLKLSGDINIKDDLCRLVLMLKGPNPMARTAPSQQSTYAAIQRDSAVILADTLLSVNKSKKAAAPAFVYVSADKLMPGIPSAYLDTKREAESILFGNKNLRTIALRPGFMYDELDTSMQSMRNVVKKVIGFQNYVKDTLFGDSNQWLNELVRPPVSTQKVAACAISRVSDPSFSGVVSLEELQNVE